jgi:hypothetical protein
MSSISDEVSKRLHRSGKIPHNEVVELRYFADYGHGFLGLFKALFEGRLEEVIRDPGPPFVDEAHIPVIKRTLLQLVHESQSRNKIPLKYASDVKALPPLQTSTDSLFE